MDISIVIPIYNEEESVDRLYQSIKKVIDRMKESTEVVLVDDGSKDRTYEKLKAIAEKDQRVKVIKFRRNFGQTAAMAAGFDFAKGLAIVTMDADLQNDPEDIPRLYAKMKEGYDIVSGWRANRKDPFFSRRLPSMIANKLISVVTGVHLHDYGCTLKIYSRDVIKHTNLYGEMHRFIPALGSWAGATIAEVKVKHYARKFGKSKYGISRTVRVLLDLFTVKFLLSYATRPIHLFGTLGLVSLFIGAASGVYLVVERLFFSMPLSNRPLLLFSIFLVFIGVQFITMGLLGEIMIRTYHEAQGKPIYTVRETLNLE